MVKEVAAITGGTSGLGTACVERFVKDGYEVVFCGRNEEAGASVATEHNATFIKCDVTVPEQVESFFNQIKEKFGRLDVLINNAGVIGNEGKLCDIPIEAYHRVVNVNQHGAWYTLKYGVKLMETLGNGGRVVNMSSLAGLAGTSASAQASHYGATKHALNGITQTLALEYIPAKIRVNAVCPTVIETDLVRKFIDMSEDKAMAHAIIANTNPMVGPNDTLPQPEDVSGVVAFLCGPDSKFINGALIPI